MSRLFVTTVLSGLLTITTPALADDHHSERHWHDGGRYLGQERRVAHHAWRKTWRRLERAERRGKRRAIREWRWAHRRAAWPQARHLHSLPAYRPHGHVPHPHGHRPYPRCTMQGVRTGVDPLPIIGGGVIGGLLGNQLGDGDATAATAGLFIGSVVGYELSRH